MASKPNVDEGRAEAPQSVGRRTWETPTLAEVGNLGGILRGGTGKLSPTDQDSGDNRKPSGLG